MTLASGSAELATHPECTNKNDEGTRAMEDIAPVRAADLPTHVEVREVGPRDGLQLEAPLDVMQRGSLIEALVATGVRRIEATAFVSPRAVPSMAGAAEVAALTKRWPQVRFSALVPNLRGAQDAIEAGIVDLEYVVSAANSHSLANVGRTTDQAIDDVGEIARLVHSAGGELEVIIATAWDCPFDGRTPEERTLGVVRRSVGLGADAVCLADTIGTTVPGRVTQLIAATRTVIGNARLGAHFHNTRGTGIASA